MIKVLLPCLPVLAADSVFSLLQAPTSPSEWLKIAQEFSNKWQFSNCIGAIDGIRPPVNSGSVFHNYKMFYSIFLIAVVDASCRFPIVDIGKNGRSCDVGVVCNSAIAAALERVALLV